MSAVAVVALLLVPSLSTLSGWTPANALYQGFCAVVGFPAIVWFGARGVVGGWSKKVAESLGRLSYPLYAIHYPLIYLYIHWISTDQHPFGENPWSTPLCVALIAIVAAVLCVKFYDEPLRRWLGKRFQTR